MGKYIFATDVDGTLLNDQGEVHPETIEAFKKAQEQGSYTVIATGRAVIRTKPLLKKIPYVDFLVCNNGSAVYDVKKDEISDYKIELNDKLETSCGIIKYINEDNVDKSNNIIRLNSKDIKLPLYIRNRKDGDKIQVKNMNGSKKVNDIFIDAKINKDIRNIYPLVVDSNDVIVFIPGLKKSNLDIPINGDYDIIVKYEKGEEK